MTELIYLEEQSMFVYLIHGMHGLSQNDLDSMSSTMTDRLGVKTTALRADRFVYYAKG
jgi:3-methyladenine DNA glycosylase Mpg